MASSRWELTPETIVLYELFFQRTEAKKNRLSAKDKTVRRVMPCQTPTSFPVSLSPLPMVSLLSRSGEREERDPGNEVG